MKKLKKEALNYIIEELQIMQKTKYVQSSTLAYIIWQLEECDPKMRIEHSRILNQNLKSFEQDTRLDRKNYNNTKNQSPEEVPAPESMQHPHKNEVQANYLCYSDNTFSPISVSVSLPKNQKFPKNASSIILNKPPRQNGSCDILQNLHKKIHLMNQINLLVYPQDTTLPFCSFAASISVDGANIASPEAKNNNHGEKL